MKYHTFLFSQSILTEPREVCPITDILKEISLHGFAQVYSKNINKILHKYPIVRKALF